jgi:transposase
VSSRKIERVCHEDLAFRVLTGNQQPDHSRISDFRRRNLDALKGLFVQILRLCQKAGMVSPAHYPKASKKGGRPPYPLGTMLRIHLLQQWYSLSDPAMEEALIEVPTMRRFAGIELISDRIPDETTILTFRTCWRSTGWASRSLTPSRRSWLLGA